MSAEINTNLQNRASCLAKIRQFEAANSSLVQGGAEWKAGRKVSGSRFATFLGVDGYKKLPDLFKTIAYGDHFEGNLNTFNGILFEPLARAYFTQLYLCDVHAYSTCVVGYKGNKNISYSPDGLCIIGGDIVMNEFKCVRSRKLVQGQVYRPYVPQVKMGLALIDIAKYAIYCEFDFKMCPITATSEFPRAWIAVYPGANTLGIKFREFSAFISQLNKVDLGAIYSAAGIKGDGSGNGSSNGNVKYTLSSLLPPLIDLSPYFENIFECNKESPLIFKYSAVCSPSTSAEMIAAQIRAITDDQKNRPLGIIQCELRDKNIVRVERTEQYLEPYLSVVDEFVTAAQSRDDSKIAEFETRIKEIRKYVAKNE